MVNYLHTYTVPLYILRSQYVVGSTLVLIISLIT